MRQLLNRSNPPLSRREFGRGSFVRTALLPELLLIISTGVLAWYCRDLLLQARQHDLDLPGLFPLFVSLLGLVVVAWVLVLGQAARSARRLAGPMHRITVAMQRTRGGDISHRVHLRRGDNLKEVAAEFNRILDWLNENPPAGVRTGHDLVEVGADRADLFEREGDESHVTVSEKLEEYLDDQDRQR